MATVFAVGRIIDYPEWELIGVWNDQKEAQNVCTDETFFVGPVVLNRAVYGTRVCPSPDRMLKDHGHNGAYFPVKEWRENPESKFGNQPSSE